MFDKLIESEPEGADFRNRRTYFMVSSVVVGALFLTAVVISIYASDYGLGTNSFELSMVLPPVEMAAVEPERLQPRNTNSQSQTQVATRQENMPSVSDSTEVPKEVSTTPNTQPVRPPGPILISDSAPSDPGGTGRDIGDPGPGGGLTPATQVAENTSIPEPPLAKKEAPKKEVIRSLGPVNGKATFLPKPVYSAAAIALHIDGKVDVQVTIDETGRVISATAVSGNIVLRPAAEQAARNAKFTPTLLNNAPVKVTGVIIYNFIR